MQVTGNSTTQTLAKESILSIQLALNGLSFSVVHKGVILSGGYYLCDQGEGVDALLLRLRQCESWMSFDFTAVRILVDTPHVVLLPREHYLKESLEALFLANGIPLEESMEVIHSEESAPVVAVMRLDRATYRLVMEYWGEQSLCFVHPLTLAMRATRSGDHLEVIRGEHTCSLVLFSQGAVQFAETLSDNSFETLLWTMQRLGEQHSLRSTRILLSGVGCKALKESLRPYYKWVEFLPQPALPKELKPLQERIPFANMIRIAL